MIDRNGPKFTKFDDAILALVTLLAVLWACLLGRGAYGAEPTGTSLAGLAGATPINMQASGTTSQGFRADNGPIIETWAAGVKRYPLVIPGRGWGHKDTIELGDDDGIAILGNGVGPLRAENAYGPSLAGGSPSRLVATNDALGFASLSYTGNDLTLSGLALQGRYAKTDTAGLAGLPRRDAGIDLDGVCTATNVALAFYESAIQAGDGAVFEGRGVDFIDATHAVEFDGNGVVRLTGGSGIGPASILTAGGDDDAWPILELASMPIDGNAAAVVDSDATGRIEVIVRNCQDDNGLTVNAHYFWDDGEVTDLNEDGEPATLPDPGSQLISLTTNTSDAVATLNTADLQDYIDSGWLSSRKPYTVPVGLFGLNDTIDFGPRTGYRLNGSGGEPLWHNLLEYDPENVDARGGPCSILVWNSTDYTLPMLRTGGYGITCDGVHGQGKWDPNNNNNIILDNVGATYPYAIGASHTNDDRCLEGWRIDSTLGIGSGKHEFPAGLTLFLFQTGIHVTDDPLIAADFEHGDQCIFPGAFRTFYCDVGFHCEQLQAFSWHFEYVEQGFCTCQFLFDDGAKFICDELSGGSSSSYGLWVRGNDTQVGPGSFEFGNINLDETVAADYLALRVEPASGGSAAKTYVRRMHVASPRADAATPLPIAKIVNSYGEHVFQNVVNAYDGMIQVQGNFAFFPTIVVEGANFRRGEHTNADPWRVLTCDVGTSAHVQLRFVNNHEEHNASGSTHGGQYYTELTETGVLTNTAGTLSWNPD
jgi:hypothetical protein